MGLHEKINNITFQLKKHIATMKGLASDPEDPDLLVMLRSEVLATDKMVKELKPLTGLVNNIKSQASQEFFEKNTLQRKIEAL